MSSPWADISGCVISLLWTSMLSSIVADQRRYVRSLTTSNCPDVCFCNTPSKIVYCSRRGLLRIPNNIPEDSLQINLNGNGFESHTLRRSNLSRYANLEHLYLSECSLESLDVDAFMDLAGLRWLDLSNNRLKVILEHTFRGLLLQHLFLNGNRHLKLHLNSFKGLSVTGLYLQDCSLSDIQPELIQPLNSTLKNLWLNGNELERLSEDLEPVLSGLQHLRLGFNPLRCDCETIWLKNFYDRYTDIFKGAMSPSCLSPRRLKGKHFNELTSTTDFRCQVPMFTNIEAYIERNEAKLKCGAIGDPAPSLYWIQPSGRTSKFNPPEDIELKGQDDLRTQRIEGILNFSWSNELSAPPAGMYICIAKNQAGNVTLTINLPDVINLPSLPPRQEWSHISHSSSQDLDHPLPDVSPHPTVRTLNIVTSRPFSYSVDAPSNSNHIQTRLLSDSLSLRTSLSTTKPNDLQLERSSKNVNYTTLDVEIKGDLNPASEVDIFRPLDSTQRLFTATEFTTAIVATHLLTILIGLLILIILSRTRYRGPMPSCCSCCYPTLSSYEKQRLQAARRAELRQQLQYASSCGTNSYYGTHKSMHTSSTDDVTECMYLNGLHHHRLQSYTDSPNSIRK